ncbi:Uncharacterised protein [uncultured Comamonas sp.]|nr:Uncharacterised protein [uncultured Comamonas sp.]
MTLWPALFIAFTGFAAIAATMARHSDAFGTQAFTPRRLQGCRAVGFVLLGVSLQMCLAHGGTSIAIAAWVGLLAFAALALGVLLTYAPHKARPLAYGAAALGWLLWGLTAR